MDIMNIPLAQSAVEMLKYLKLGWIDIVFGGVLFFALIVGYRHGAVREFPKLISVLGGLFLTLAYYLPISQWLGSNTPLPQGVTVPVAYAAILISSVLVFYLVFGFLGHLIEVKLAVFIEKIGGIAAGICRYVLWMGLISHFALLLSLEFINQAFQSQSVFGKFLGSVPQKTYDKLSAVVPVPSLNFVPQITVGQ